MNAFLNGITPSTTGEVIVSNKIYKLATFLASDLAEDYMASNISDMMITDSKAKAIRELSEANTDQMSSSVQEYRRDQRAIYGALYSLIDGYKGFKIVKNGDC